MADTSPLGTARSKNALKDAETNDLTSHYKLAAAGQYANRQYADISLLRRQQN